MVSVENKTPNSSPIDNSYLLNAPIKTSNINEESPFSESVSPRLIPRRLDFTEISPSSPRTILDDETRSLSPISFYNDEFESVGECGVCYEKLPMRSNHIFTICGHLFCVKCLLNWNNNSSTCPLCREKLYDNLADAFRADEIDDDGVSVDSFMTNDDIHIG